MSRSFLPVSIPVTAAVLLWAGSLSIRSAEPTVNSIFPAGGQAGSEVSITVNGKWEGQTLRAWADHPGIVLEPQASNGVFLAKIDSSVPPGPHLLRFFTSAGAAPPRVCLVGRDPEIPETEPNNARNEAQPLPDLPITVNGRLEKTGDTDSFALKLEAGQSLTASLAGYGLGSPIDPFLQLLDSRGVPVAFEHDTHNLDPRLVFQADRTDTFVLQVAAFAYPPRAEVRFFGAADAVYRLHLRLGEACAQSGTARGSIGDRIPERFQCQPEKEPNDSDAAAQPIVLPGLVQGEIQSAGDVDRYAFTARKGEKYAFHILASDLDSLLDSVLTLYDEQGTQLAQNDDAKGKPDSFLDWTAAADGRFIVTVADRMQRGGASFAYLLQAGPPVPDFEVTTGQHAFLIEPGKTNSFKAKVERSGGLSGALGLEVENLPEGVSAQLLGTEAKNGEFEVALIADRTAPPAGQPIRIRFLHREGDRPLARPLLYSLRPEGRGGEILIRRTDQLWLTVAREEKKE